MKRGLHVVGLCLLLAVLSLGTAIAQTPVPYATAPRQGPNSIVQNGAALPTMPDPESFSKAMAPVNIPPVIVRPTIDGTISPGEWTGALELNLTSPVPHLAPMGSTVWMFNDACYLYVGASIPTPDYTGIHYAGNATNFNIWFDLDQDGVWDDTTPPDGNMAIPAPGDNYPPNRACYITYQTQQTYMYTNAIMSHLPWYILGFLIDEEQVYVRKNDSDYQVTYVEAKIDIRNSPLRMTMGQPINIRIHMYGGWFTLNPYDGNMLITGYWPYIGNPDPYFYGNYATALDPATPAVVVPEADPYNVINGTIADNPNTGGKAYEIGDQIGVEIEYEGIVMPKVGEYTLKIYGPLPSDALAYTVSGTFGVDQPLETIINYHMVTLVRGFYRFELGVVDPDDCGRPYQFFGGNFLMMNPGEVPCVVWPGDVNRDDIVNYTDRSVLNDYIHDANLNSSWLVGPFRAAPVAGPLGMFAWMPQVALPWSANGGCHMDADGNGYVNNLDYVAIKMNWMRTAGPITPKSQPDGVAAGCMLEQNYPNPFNPSTTLTYRVTERSEVELTVTDVAGNAVTKLVNSTLEAGSHTTDFNASDLPSGSYFATIRINGLESGMKYTRTVKMLLTK
jgi:hypothetical protein